MNTPEPSAAEVAQLFVRQTRLPDGNWPERPAGEPSAITIWEEWITSDPERAWPVFSEILRLRSDDETLYQVGARIRQLLWRHYDQFHLRIQELFDIAPRLLRILGDDPLDRAHYTDAPYDRDRLIEAYTEQAKHAGITQRIKGMAKSDPKRAVRIAIEIVHRATKAGLEVFDARHPLEDVLFENGAAVIDDIESAALDSVLLRRALWDMLRSWRKLPEEIAERCKRVVGTTTEFTDDFSPWVLPARLTLVDERLIDSYIAHAKTFWAWEDLSDLVSTDTDEAWTVIRVLIERGDDRQRSLVAAGPLEDLLKDHPEKFDDIAAVARENTTVAQALLGVYIFPEHEVYERYRELLDELGLY